MNVPQSTAAEVIEDLRHHTTPRLLASNEAPGDVWYHIMLPIRRVIRGERDMNEDYLCALRE